MPIPHDMIYLPAPLGKKWETYGVKIRPDWDQVKDYPLCACGRLFVPIHEGDTSCFFCLFNA